MVSDLLVYVPAEAECMVELLGLVKGTLEGAVAGVEAITPSWPSAAAATYPPAQVGCSTLTPHLPPCTGGL